MYSPVRKKKWVQPFFFSSKQMSAATYIVVAQMCLGTIIVMGLVLWSWSKGRKAAASRPRRQGKPAAPAPAPDPGPAPGGKGAVIDEKARCTYYFPISNDPPGSRNCAYQKQCTSPDQGSPSSAAHAANGSSPYKKGGLYTIAGAGRPPFCVRIDDTCAACKGTWIDVFLEDGQKLPFDYAKVTEGC